LAIRSRAGVPALYRLAKRREGAPTSLVQGRRGDRKKNYLLAIMSPEWEPVQRHQRRF
jgi:hypothetical protein